MYSGEWWKGPLSDRSQSRGPPGLSLGRPAATAVVAAPDRKHTQQWRLRLMTPHRAIRDGGGGGWGMFVWGGGREGVQQTKTLFISWLLHWDDKGSCITSTSPVDLNEKGKRNCYKWNIWGREMGGQVKKHNLVTTLCKDEPGQISVFSKILIYKMWRDTIV